MKKSKMIYMEKPLSDREIDEYMDFSSTLKKSKEISAAAKTSAINLKYGLATFIGLVSIVSFTYLKFSNDFTLFNEQGNVSETTVPVNLKNEAEIKSINNDRIENLNDSFNEIIEKKSLVENHPENDAKQIILVDSSEGKKEDAQVKNVKTIKSETEKEQFVEAQPVKGYTHLYEYFANNLQYPEKARLDSVRGTVLVEFEVLETGNIENIKIVKGKTKELNREAIRLISDMPVWKPALINGKPVSTKLTLPLTFQLEQLQ